MRRSLMVAAFVLSCAHVPPTSTKDVPSPWPEARADAGNPPAEAARQKFQRTRVGHQFVGASQLRRGAHVVSPNSSSIS